MKLADRLTLPPEAVARTIGILGQTGSGKTWDGMKLAELFLDAKAQIACLDPTGVWWGLKAEGKGPGFPILVMGGVHGDMPLAPTAGTLIADFLVQSGHSVVLDLSAFNSNAEHERFVTDFAERLYRAKNDARTPLHLMLDEADAFAPQSPMPGERRMLGAIDVIVRRGRSRGLGMTMMTQRPAALNKNVLTQVDLLVAHRVTGHHDHKALGAWTALYGTKEQKDAFLGELPRLPTGRAFFWSPSWLGIFTQGTVLGRRTFDSGKTPEPGAAVATPKLAKVDKEKLTAEILATAESAKANDPKELQREVSRLQGELTRAKTAQPAPEPVRVEVPVLGEDFSDMKGRMIALRNDLSEVIDKILETEKRIAALNGRAPVKREVTEGDCARAGARMDFERPRAVRTAQSNGTLGKCERAILTTLAQYQPHACTKRKVSAVSQYSITSSTFQNSVSSLRTQGFIRGFDPLDITPSGVQALGAYDPLPIGRAAIEHWANVLGKCEGRILRVLLDQHNHMLTKEQIAGRSEYSITSSSFQNALSALRTRELIEGRDPITLLIP